MHDRMQFWEFCLFLVLNLAPWIILIVLMHGPDDND
jgi:hypothetical protein